MYRGPRHTRDRARRFICRGPHHQHRTAAATMPSWSTRIGTLVVAVPLTFYIILSDTLFAVLVAAATAGTLSELAAIARGFVRSIDKDAVDGVVSRTCARRARCDVVVVVVVVLCAVCCVLGVCGCVLGVWLCVYVCACV